jgi:hypothetical protein
MVEREVAAAPDPHSLRKSLQVAAAAAQNVCQVITNLL